LGRKPTKRGFEHFVSIILPPLVKGHAVISLTFFLLLLTVFDDYADD
jgi:hypothetical protein